MIRWLILLLVPLWDSFFLFFVGRVMFLLLPIPLGKVYEPFIFLVYLFIILFSLSGLSCSLCMYLFI